MVFVLLTGVCDSSSAMPGAGVYLVCLQRESAGTKKDQHESCDKPREACLLDARLPLLNFLLRSLNLRGRPDATPYTGNAPVGS